MEQQTIIWLEVRNHKLQELHKQDVTWQIPEMLQDKHANMKVQSLMISLGIGTKITIHQIYAGQVAI